MNSSSNTHTDIPTVRAPGTDDALAEPPLPYKHKGDLTNGPVSRHMVKLALPMVWGIFAVISVQVADTYFISLLGTRELAAVSFTFPIAMMITHIMFGLNIATSSVISRMIGQKQRDDAQRVVLHSLFFAFISGTLLAALGYIFLEPLFTLMGANEETLPIIQDYMPVWLLASILLSVPSNGNSAIRADGDSFKPAMVMTLIAAVNIILDPLLIFGGFGFPALGVQGAAYATLIAYSVGTVAGLYVLIFNHKLISLDGFHWDTLGNSAKRLFIIAVPAGLTNAIQPIVRAILVGLLAGYGQEAVAAFGIVNRIEIFSMITIIALSTAMGPIIGQNWGAKNFERVFRTINIAIGFNFIWSFSAALIMAFGSDYLTTIFSTDPKVVEVAVLFFWTVPFSYAFGNLIFGWSSAFNAMGRPERAFIMITSKAILTIAGVFIGHWTYGILGIFGAIAGVNVLSGLFFHALSWNKCRQYHPASS